MRLPQGVIIGAMKCGTSTLAAQLGAQPGMFLSDPKEPNFFSDDTNYDRGLEWYASLFEAAQPDDLMIEASTHYTKMPRHPATLERLRPVLTDARFVYVMRQPIDRLISQYVHEWTVRKVPSPTRGVIDEAVRANQWMIDYGRYAMQIEPWLSAFGPERVLPVFAERLRARPEAELERIAQHLGYREQTRWLRLEDRNVSSERLRISGARDLLLNVPVLKQIRRGLVPQGLRDRVKSAWQMRERPKLSDAYRAVLEAAYDEDLARLGTLLGLAEDELTCATFEGAAVGRTYDFMGAMR
ncbi:MAG: sulfotransferase [Planctomycetota bacterium]